MNISILIAILSIAATQVEEDLVKKGILLFEHGDYKQSIAILNRVIKENLAKDEKELIECYKYLGAAYFYLEDMKLADANFRQLILLDPNFSMDPFLFPPSMVLFFDRIKKEVSREKTKNRPDVIDHNISRGTCNYSLYINLLPLGIPQFATEQKSKGISVLVLQAATLTANVFSYWKIDSMIDKYGYVKDRQTADTVNIYKTVQIGSLVAFGLVYIYSAIDGFANTHYYERGGGR